MRNPCIEHRFLGGTETVDFEEFAQKVVQDHERALEVADTMLRTGEPYKWNEDQPEFYAEFEVTNSGALRAQLQGESPTAQGGYFSRLRRRLDDAIAAADAGFKSESDGQEPPDSWSEAAREFDSVGRTLRTLRTMIS